MSSIDIKSRRTIVTDFANTLFVEAGAGSGKTTSMVSRIVMLLLSGQADIREIVALTFTNEGAASFKSKIRQELEKANLTGMYDPRDREPVRLSEVERERIRHAMSLLPLAQLCTIHSFCLTLLKERPIEAGIDPQFEMDTEGILTTPFDDAWKQYILRTAQNEDPFIEFAVKQGIDLEHVRAMAGIRCGNPDLTIHAENPGPPPPVQIERTFQEIVKLAARLQARVDVLKGDTNSKVGKTRLAFVMDLPSILSRAETSESRLRTILDLDIVGNWTKKQTEFSGITEQMEAQLAPLRLQYYNDVHCRIARFVEAFQLFYSSFKKSTSSLDFVDLLFLTRTLLKENLEVREFFKSRFRYILVDEAQDIDPLQTEIVFFLSEKRGGAASRWTSVVLEPGKLFMVGDPKQSIYRFRRADIAMYEQAKDLIRSQGGAIIALERNFRSAKPIIDFVNMHFSSSFKQFEAGIRQHIHPEYKSIEAASRRGNPQPGNLTLVISPEEGTGTAKGDVLPLEIGKVISFIRHVTSADGPKIKDDPDAKPRPVQFGDIMILMKVLSDVREYTRGFEEAGIPYNEIGGKTFFDTDDLRGMVLALKAVDDPTDTISLYGALSSPAFGISDKRMFEWVSAGHPFSLFASTEDNDQPLPRALQFLRSLHFKREQLMPSGVLRALFDATGVCHMLFRESNGVQKTSKMFRLLEMVHEIESDRSRSFRQVVANLEDVMDAPDPRVANIAITRAAADAVKITSIHKAKGLEAPVVILANATIRDRDLSKDRFVPDVYFRRTEEKMVIPYGEGGYYSLNPEDLLGDEQLKEDCEAERLRYVAATRARDILVICVPGENAKQSTFNGQFSISLAGNKQVEAVGVSPPRKSPVRREKGAGGGKGRLTSIAHQFKAARHTREDRFGTLGDRLRTIQPAFKSVHEAMEIDPEIFKEPRKMRGTGFGRIVHRAMQHWVQETHFDVNILLDEWMEEEGVPARLRAEVVETIEAISGHPKVLEARSSAEKYCEWEYFLPREDGIQNGVIDLLYRDQSGKWVIVDYKTDDVSDPGRKAKLDGMYAAQLRFYASAVEQITGNHVAETIVLYTDELLYKKQ